jgi:hypothetical protein
MQQASMPQAPRQQSQNWGGGGGFRMQQASAPAPSAPRQSYTPRSGGQQRTRGR